jgi:hypothetical protein
MYLQGQAECHFNAATRIGRVPYKEAVNGLGVTSHCPRISNEHPKIYQYLETIEPGW